MCLWTFYICLSCKWLDISSYNNFIYIFFTFTYIHTTLISLPPCILYINTSCTNNLILSHYEFAWKPDLTSKCNNSLWCLGRMHSSARLVRLTKSTYSKYNICIVWEEVTVKQITRTAMFFSFIKLALLDYFKFQSPSN